MNRTKTIGAYRKNAHTSCQGVEQAEDGPNSMCSGEVVVVVVEIDATVSKIRL